jgi:hypothetical protein
MYLTIGKKPRKTNRNKSARHKAKLKRKNAKRKNRINQRSKR